MAEYRIASVEFWRTLHRLEADRPEAAVQLYHRRKAAGALPEPERLLMGEVEAEQVLDAQGEVLINDPPPPDDAERMLLAHMWRRMAEFSEAHEALEFSIRFICGAKRWDEAEMFAEVYAS